MMFGSVRVPTIAPGNVKVLVTRVGVGAAEIEAELKVAPLAGTAFIEFRAAGGALLTELERQGLRAHVVDPALDGNLRGLRAVTQARVDAYQLVDELPLDATQQRDLLRARQVEDALIGPDLGFARLVFLDEWREVAVRLERLDEPLPELGETVREAADALGLSPLIARTQRVFEEYGRALGILGPGGQFAPTYDAFLAALRRLLLAIELSFPAGAPTAVRTYLVGPIEETFERQRDERRKAEQRRALAATAGAAPAGTAPQA